MKKFDQPTSTDEGEEGGEGGRGGGSGGGSGEIKKPRTAYNFFCSLKAAEFKLQFPNVRFLFI